MTTKERQLQLLLETAKHYNLGNRSQDANGRCVYTPSEKSEGCAIGRLVQDKELCKKWRNEGVHGIFAQLPQDLQGLGVDFLYDLQRLHDTTSFWTETGLNEKGEKYVAALKERYELLNN